MSLNDTHTFPLAAPRHLVAPSRSAFWLLGASFVVTMLGNTLPTPLYVLYQRKFGFSTLMITVVFAVYAAGVLLALALFGRASDQIGRRPVLLAGLACAALSAVAFLMAKGLVLLLVGRVLSGLSVGIFVGTATAALVDLAGPGRSQRATVTATASNITGLGLGALLGGVLAQAAPDPLRLAFWVDLGLVILAIAAVWSIPETVEVAAHPRMRISEPDLPPEVRSTLDELLWPVLPLGHGTPPTAHQCLPEALGWEEVHQAADPQGLPDVVGRADRKTTPSLRPLAVGSRLARLTTGEKSRITRDC